MTSFARSSTIPPCSDTPAACDRPARRIGLLPRLAATIRLWRRRAQESRELLEMSDSGLHDIGLSSSEARHAARKPVWRA